ncbi:MAG: N-acetylmuramoyl-L-alanine amidase [Polyangiaceae bacterium]|nr:N-acetylmuramoyl-L-alanine amidase [Polyangiaceae bacterium]
MRHASWILLCLVAVLVGCAAPNLGDGEYEACELEPQTLSEPLSSGEDVASTQEALSSFSCGMKAATGYTSGKSFKIKVVTVDGKHVEWKTANAYLRMAKAAAKSGVQIRIVSGFRTMSEQQYLYNCYKSCSCNSCSLAATPGYSNHQSGHALDLNTSAPGVLSWLTKHGGSYGFKRTVPGEAWHWEWWGKDPGQGPCNGGTLKAKLTKRWSNARRYRGKAANYVVCAGKPMKLAFTFKNTGTAIWHDIDKRGSKVGSDVFLVTANGKKDKLTGKKRFSVRLNKNKHVHGDRKAKNCSSKNGCRKTTFIEGGVHAKAPKKTGVYTTRWRLRDYSKAWGKKSKGFGPKVQLKFKVVSCNQPKQECGCRVWCNDGKSHKLAASIDSAAACKSVAQTYCKPASYLSHSFQACAVDDNQAVGGGPQNGSESDPAADPGSDPTTDPSADPTTDPSADPTTDPSADPTDPDPNAEPPEDDETDPGALPAPEDEDTGLGIDEPDDPDFVDDGFPGYDENAEPRDGASCSVSTPGSPTSGAFLLLAALGAVLVVRRRRRRAFHGGLLALVALVVVGCGADASAPAPRASLSGDSPLVATFQDAEAESGVPAEMLATLSWLQARLSMNLSTESHEGPQEVGLMAIAGDKLNQSAEEARLEPSVVAVDARANVRAAAAWLAAEARREGLSPTTDSEWAPVLRAWGGDDVASATLRLLATGWDGSDDDGYGVSVTGSGAPEAEASGTAASQQELGYPGGKWSPAYSGNYTHASRGKSDIRYVVIHTTQGSYAGTINWFKNPAAKVSSHYVVRSHDGAITHMVDDKNIAWHDACFNSYSIGIEHEGFVESPKKWYTEAMYRSSARLTAWLCDKYGIPKDRTHILGHGDAPDCSDHTDPGSGWNWSEYMKLVKTGGKVKTLKAKAVKKWSNARRYRGKKADYVACAGDDLKLSFTFKNVGSAIWHDIKGRGKNVGSDVFLVTSNGKKDKLTGRVRYSLRNNKNQHVHGDRKAKNCSTQNGCRKTTFVKGGMKAKAPKKPGIYHSRWRLRDYSKAWGKKSHGFGPKVDLSLRVVSCNQPKQECGCRVWCSDGKSHKLAASIDSSAACKSIAKTYCAPSKYLSHSYQACAVDPTQPAPPSETQSDSGVDPDPGVDPEAEGDEDDPNGFVIDDTEDDPDVLPVEDDADFTDDGFDGDADRTPDLGSADGGCAISTPPAPASPLPIAAFLALGALVEIRRRARR